MNILIYTTTTCPFCKMQKEYFDSKNIKYGEILVDENPDAAQKMIEMSGQLGVPFTVITKDDGEEWYTAFWSYKAVMGLGRTAPQKNIIDMTPDRPLSAHNFVNTRLSQVETDPALADRLKVQKKPAQFKTTPDGRVYKDADSFLRDRSEEEDEKYDFISARSSLSGIATHRVIRSRHFME